MATDAMHASAAATDTARAAAAAASTGQAFDAQAYLKEAFPQLADVSVAMVVRYPEESEPYVHRLVKEDGTVLERSSVASSQRIETTVSVQRPFVTPLGLFLASFSGSSGYAVRGTGAALHDTTATSGRW